MSDQSAFCRFAPWDLLDKGSLQLEFHQTYFKTRQNQMCSMESSVRDRKSGWIVNWLPTLCVFEYLKDLRVWIHHTVRQESHPNLKALSTIFSKECASSWSACPTEESTWLFQRVSCYLVDSPGHLSNNWSSQLRITPQLQSTFHHFLQRMCIKLKCVSHWGIHMTIWDKFLFFGSRPRKCLQTLEESVQNHSQT